MPIFTSACPRNCYGTCGLRVTVTGGRVTGLDPHPGNLATPGGPCLKGLSYLEEDPERLLRIIQEREGALMQALFGHQAVLDTSNHGEALT